MVCPTECNKRLRIHSVPRIVVLITMSVNLGTRSDIGFTQLKPNFYIGALIFVLISMVEELSQLTKHANKILVLIFLTKTATILDKHTVRS